jgi:hypothetical protein
MGQPMTTAEVTSFGTRTFKAPLDKTFEATANALKADGFEITVSKPEKGLIITNRRLIRAQGNGAGQAVAYTRQYRVAVRAKGDGTEVELAPSIFSGEADISGKPIWVIEGPEGERAVWTKLFASIQDLI